MNVVDINRVIDISKPATQDKFGGLIGVSQKTVSGLVSKNILLADDSLENWLIKYCEHIREQAAGRATNGDLDLATERAGLAREQRLRLEMQNAVTRREYGPIIEMELGLADVLAMVSAKLDAIVGKIKKRSDALTADDLDVVSTVISDVRNDVADTVIEWFDEDSEEDDET